MFNRIEQAKFEAESNRRMRQLLNGYEPEEEIQLDPTAVELAKGWGWENSFYNRINKSGRQVEDVLKEVQDKTGPFAGAHADKLPKKAPMNVAEIEEQERKDAEDKAIWHRVPLPDIDPEAMLKEFRKIVEARKLRRSDPLPPSYHNPFPRKINYGRVYRAIFHGGPKDGDIVDLDPTTGPMPRFIFPVFRSASATMMSVNDPPTIDFIRHHVYEYKERWLDPARDMEILHYQYEGEH